MIIARKWAKLAAISCAALAVYHKTGAQMSTAPPTSSPQVRIAISQTLPQLDGSHLHVSVVEVKYGPGGSSPPHSHPCPVVGYIVEGTIRIQLKSEPETIYKVGDSFYEAANGVHLVSANASGKEPAKLLAYFVCDHETPLSVDVPETRTSGGGTDEQSTVEPLSCDAARPSQ